jgi:hypothetical protein
MTSIVLLTIINIFLGNQSLPYSGENDHPDHYTITYQKEIFPFEDFGIVPDVIDKSPMDILEVPK